VEDDDDENSSMFLRESLLGRKRAEEVIEVIKEMIGKLPSQVTNEETPEEFELGGSAEIEKATAEGEKIVNKGEKIVDGGKKKGKVDAGQKKPAARKHSVRSPSPAQSTSKHLMPKRNPIALPETPEVRASISLARKVKVQTMPKTILTYHHFVLLYHKEFDTLFQF